MGIEEVPYMQRAGGAWDGSDLKGAALRRAKKKQSQGMYTAGKWLDSDREYEEWTGRDVLLHAVQRRQTGKGRGSSETERHLAGRAALARRRRTVGEAGLEDQGVEARRAEDVLRPVLGPPVCTLLCVSRRLDAERRTSLPPSALPPSEASCQ